MSYNDTLFLINFVLVAENDSAREVLHSRLVQMKKAEAEFCAGVMKHGPSLSLSSNQWFDFFKKIPNPLFRDEPYLMNKLSENQRNQLKFV
jgi:hypothetical protein